MEGGLKMAGYMKPELSIEDLIIIVGLIGGQFYYAGNSVLMSYLMSLGLSSLTIVIFSSLATFLVLSPFALCFERKKWPEKFGLDLVLRLVLIAFAGVTLFQYLFLKGIQLTSPAIATAMPNLSPGLIFIIAWTFRLEKVKLSCLYSRVKILGALLCVVGALTMSLMHSTSPVEETKQTSKVSSEVAVDGDRIIGCIYLFAAVFAMAANVVLQASTLGQFPAPMSLCAITSLIGAFTSAAVQLLQDHKLDLGMEVMSLAKTMGYCLLAGSACGACISFTGWALKKRGPVFVSMFSPIATVISVVLSAITIGDPIDIGSVAGMFIMFIGLYFVLWAKKKEGLSSSSESDQFDAEKPLLN